MKWFGESWDAPVNRIAEHVDTPVGASCMHCDQPIEAKQKGLLVPYLSADGQWIEEPWHMTCFLRHIIGPPPPPNYIESF